MLRRYRRPAGSRSARSCCSASSRSPTRPARPADRHTAWAYMRGPQTARLGGARRPPRRPDGGTDRALCPGLPRPDPGAARADAGRSSSVAMPTSSAATSAAAATASTSAVASGAAPCPLPHAGSRPLHRQRRDVPGRRRARRARTGRRPAGPRAQALKPWRWLWDHRQDGGRRERAVVTPDDNDDLWGPRVISACTHCVVA